MSRMWICKKEKRIIFNKWNQMVNIKVRCPKCGAINTMDDFRVINNVMHERCRKCGYLQEMSLVRCLKKKEWLL